MKTEVFTVNRIWNQVNGKHFVKGAFLISDDVLKIMRLTLSISQSCRQAFLPTVVVAFLDFSGIEWAENICCVLRVKTPFPNFSGVVLRESFAAFSE